MNCIQDNQKLKKPPIFVPLVPHCALRGPRGCCIPKDGATDGRPLRRDDLNYHAYAPPLGQRPLGHYYAPLGSNPVAFRAQEVVSGMGRSYGLC